MKPLRSALLLAFLLLPGLASAQEKSLRWSEVAVRARLDAQGVLHIEERQVIVFTGDWNGGERKFNRRLGERLDLRRLSRVDPATGEARPLFEGDLADVDEFAWVDGTTLRWRSRLPSDPPFAETAIPYVLDYTLTGILEKSGGLYRLRHAFPWRKRTERLDAMSLTFLLPGLAIFGSVSSPPSSTTGFPCASSRGRAFSATSPWRCCPWPPGAACSTTPAPAKARRPSSAARSSPAPAVCCGRSWRSASRGGLHGSRRGVLFFEQLC